MAARIDRAMVDRAAQLGPRILVMPALDSTLGPTAALIRESAAALQVPVALETQVVDGSWTHFTSGQHDAYQQAIVNAVRAGVGTASVVVLAQASVLSAGVMLLAKWPNRRSCSERVP